MSQVLLVLCKFAWNPKKRTVLEGSPFRSHASVFWQGSTSTWSEIPSANIGKTLPPPCPAPRGPTLAKVAARAGCHMASGRPMVKRVLAAFPVGPVEIRSKTVSCASAIKSGLCLVQRCICMSELCHSQGAKGQVPCSAWSCLPVSWSPLTERFGFQVIPMLCVFG